MFRKDCQNDVTNFRTKTDQQANERSSLKMRMLTLSKVPGLAIVFSSWISLIYNAKYRRTLLEEVKVETNVERKTTSTLQHSRSPRPPPESSFIKYHELEPLLRPGDVTNRYTNNRYSISAYSKATIVRPPTVWFPKRRSCKETCCVETIAISLDHEKHKTINALDGKDLADLIVEDWQNRQHRAAPNTIKYHANNLTQEILPCLVPGTVIFLQNHEDGVRHFWLNLRPKIQVPYVLIMAGSDVDSPGLSERFLSDPLLLKLYGTNPKFSTIPQFVEHQHKYQPIPLGLSRRYPQERQMLPYLHYTEYANPFLDVNRFDLSLQPLNFEKDVFVHFGLKGHRRKYRQSLWNMLCPDKTRSGSSCNQDTESLSVHELYRDLSRYRFGVSPIGYGYDCYRTYELLLLGVIPIIEERDPESKILFDGLPVIHMPNMTEAQSKQEFVDAIQQYLASDAFQNASFEKGWERLYLQHNRHQILKATGRDKDILKVNGKQYYQAFHYSRKDSRTNEQETFCRGKGCDTTATWLQNPKPELSPEDHEWISHWEVASN